MIRKRFGKLYWYRSVEDSNNSMVYFRRMWKSYDEEVRNWRHLTPTDIGLKWNLQKRLAFCNSLTLPGIITGYSNQKTIALIGGMISVNFENTITGGTGRFAGATGSFTYKALTSTITWISQATFEGTITC